MHTDTITSFTGPYRFLSNFHRIELLYHGKPYSTVEHAYQAAKIDLHVPNYDELCRQIQNEPTPGRAKRLGRNVPLRPDWHKVKLGIMKQLIAQKFTQHDLATLLINTAPAVLIEGNSWGDCYWGVCNGIGANHLGHILMVTRGGLKYERDSLP